MKTFLVTVKLPKRDDHDPHNKKTGMCPAAPRKLCSDMTGEHHTILLESESLDDAKRHWSLQGHHVTRVEEV